MYKPPIEKRSGDLQWRIVHGSIATNRYRAHFDPLAGIGCPFCELQETVFHLFADCSRLLPLFEILGGWCQTLGEVFTLELYIYGPKYKRSKREIYQLLNFIFGQAKLAVWLSRKSKIGGMGQTDVVLIYEGLMKSRLRIEFEYYRLNENIEEFKFKWAINNCICDVDYNGNLQIYV